MAVETANNCTSDRRFFIKEGERDSALKIDDGEIQVTIQIASPWGDLQLLQQGTPFFIPSATNSPKARGRMGADPFK